MSDLERAPDVPEQAVTAAEILSAPLDPASLRLIRDTLRSEYARAESEHNQHARIIYLTFRTLFRTFEAILEEPPERGAGATYRLLPALQPIAATSVSP